MPKDGYPEEAETAEPRLSPTRLLELLVADPAATTRHVYLLQATSRRLTIYAQQTRALNLVFALKSQGILAEKTRVDIIGGGFAGITAAVAATYLKCDVTVFERKPELLHMQTGSYTRWVHPNIFDWPESVSEKEDTDLPFLNWRAAPAAEVSRRVLAELTDHQRARPFHIEHEDVDLRDDGTSLSVRGVRRTSDVVIVAIGFGLERTLADLPFRSYWMCDALHQPVMDDAGELTDYVVSGTGDGGLIDLLRLRIKDFRQDLLVREIFGRAPQQEISSIATLKIELRDIRRAILAEPDEGRQLDLLESRFERLRTTAGFEIIKARLSERLRSDTFVYLHGRTDRFLSPHASILHTFLAFVLNKLQAFDYHWGAELEIERDVHAMSVVLPERGAQKKKKVRARDTIVRYGPDAPAPTGLSRLIETYRNSLRGGRISDLIHTSRRVEGNMNEWWFGFGVPRPEATGWTGNSERPDTRESARWTSGLLEESVSLQRSLFVRGAIGEFINGPMYDAFHDLVYTYRDDEWASISWIVAKSFDTDPLKLFECSLDPKNRESMWAAFAGINGSRPEGSRLYHPAFFQDSEEERRLDQVLEYFNMVGSYWTRGLLKDEDIEPLDTYILYLSDRKAISYYLSYCEEIWTHRDDIRRKHVSVPFPHLRKLLASADTRRKGSAS